MEVRDQETNRVVAEPAAPCLRQCPSIGGEPGGLITHTIAPAACLQRQRELYHKCFRCDYRGKPAGFVLAPSAQATPNGNGTDRAGPNGTAANGVGRNGHA